MKNLILSQNDRLGQIITFGFRFLLQFSKSVRIQKKGSRQISEDLFFQNQTFGSNFFFGFVRQSVRIQTNCQTGSEWNSDNCLADPLRTTEQTGARLRPYVIP